MGKERIIRCVCPQLLGGRSTKPDLLPTFMKMHIRNIIKTLLHMGLVSLPAPYALRNSTKTLEKFDSFHSRFHS